MWLLPYVICRHVICCTQIIGRFCPCYQSQERANTFALEEQAVETARLRHPIKIGKIARKSSRQCAWYPVYLEQIFSFIQQTSATKGRKTMSRLLTMSELYTLLLECDLHKSPAETRQAKNALPTAMPLNTQSPILWVGPGTAVHHTPIPIQPRPQRQVAIATDLADLMEDMAQASGLNAGEAWSEAARAWIVQRQHDMQELASPAGRELSLTVQRVWTTIDAQMLDLREKSA
jgi:hypothetical protein